LMILLWFPLPTALAQAPPNDICAGAIALTEGQTNSTSTANATTTGEENTCDFTFGKGVWFTYTPSFTGLALVRTCGSSFNTELAVFTGTCDALTFVTCGYEDPAICGGGNDIASFFG